MARYSFYRRMRGPLTNLKAVSKKEIIALDEKRNLALQVASSHFNNKTRLRICRKGEVIGALNIINYVIRICIL
jgi:hypothetical protein